MGLEAEWWTHFISLFAQKTFWLARLKLGKYILFFEWGSRLMFKADHSQGNTFYKFSCKTKHLSRIRIVRPTAQNIVHNLECVWVVLLSSAVETLWPIKEIKSENKIVVFAKHQSILKVRNVQNYWQCNKFLTFQIYFNFHGWQVYWNVSWTHVHMCNSYLSKPIIFVSVSIKKIFLISSLKTILWSLPRYEIVPEDIIYNLIIK